MLTEATGLIGKLKRDIRKGRGDTGASVRGEDKKCGKGREK